MAPWRHILEEYSALRGEVIQPKKLNESGKRQYNPLKKTSSNFS